MKEKSAEKRCRHLREACLTTAFPTVFFILAHCLSNPVKEESATRNLGVVTYNLSGKYDLIPLSLATCLDRISRYFFSYIAK